MSLFNPDQPQLRLVQTIVSTFVGAEEQMSAAYLLDKVSVRVNNVLLEVEILVAVVRIRQWPGRMSRKRTRTRVSKRVRKSRSGYVDNMTRSGIRKQRPANT